VVALQTTALPPWPVRAGKDVGLRTDNGGAPRNHRPLIIDGIDNAAGQSDGHDEI